MPEPLLQKEIRRLERFVLVVRAFAVGWCGFTAITFGGLGLQVPVVSTYDDFAASRPLFLGGTILVMFFLVVLSWPLKRDIRNRISRLILVLRWQVATGLVIAFTLGFVVREELRMGFWIFGAYLVIPAIFLMFVLLCELGLRSKYAELDELARIDERETSLRFLATAVASELVAIFKHRTGWRRWL
jgi:hypothetical protein